MTLRDGQIIVGRSAVATMAEAARMKLSLRTAARIAWRETRSSMTKFLFVVLAVAAGVGALSRSARVQRKFSGDADATKRGR